MLLFIGFVIGWIVGFITGLPTEKRKIIFPWVK